MSGVAWIQSFTGRAIRILEPTPDQVDIRDIAHALSQVCRFGGQCRVHYSVAQHSALVAENVPRPMRLLALLHDAAEAYIGDIVTPLKHTPEMRAVYMPIEAAWARAIGERFGLGDALVELPAEVKRADLRALLTEKRDLLQPMEGVTLADWYGADVELPPPFALPIFPMRPDAAERRFLADFCMYRGGQW